MAPGAWAASLLAQQPRGPRRTLKPESMRRNLDRLPCEILTLTPTMAAQLRDWGCDTLGHLRRLPRAGLAQRGLSPLLEQLDRAYHPAQPTADWLTPPLAFQASGEPAFHGISLAAIETALIPLLSALCQYLQAHQAAIDQMHLTLHHDPARISEPETHLTLALSRPQWEVEDCLRLCRLRIRALNLPGPVRRVTLVCPHCLPRHPLSSSLLPDPRIDQQREERLLDVLRARLGAACLRYPRLQDWPLPEQAESWNQASLPTRLIPPTKHPRWPGSRPFWLLSAPIPLATRQDHPVWRNEPLRLLSGPERIEDGWWRSRPIGRDYFIARDARSVRYWIFHDLKSGHWFLHGLFA
ncbi:Protein ImuB OS=Castellaniella defragrans OX=75697 GN=HNR28_001364 PE=4 SV=1 [Castellaniella defragrans]